MLRCGAGTSTCTRLDLIVVIILLERYSVDSIVSLFIVLWINNLSTCYYPIGYCGTVMPNSWRETAVLSILQGLV
jgi:hypothetical protein